MPVCSLSHTAGMKSRPFDMTVHTNADVLSLWTTLVPAAERGDRSLWLTFLDRDGRPLPTVIPIHDRPAEPDRLMCRNLRKILADLASSSPVQCGLLLLCRPGSNVAGAGDHRWAEALRREIGAELCPWPVHLATPAGIQSLETDGLSAAS
jgi:hypothetical protein